jgi:hypothetical protein
MHQMTGPDIFKDLERIKVYEQTLDIHTSLLTIHQESCVCGECERNRDIVIACREQIATIEQKKPPALRPGENQS